MFETRKLLVFIFVLILFVYMVYITFKGISKYKLRKSVFLVEIAGLGLITAATFFDFISIMTHDRFDNVMKVCFTLGAIIFITGIVLWDRYMRSTIGFLYEISRTDPMTGIYNRNGIEDMFKRASSANGRFYVMVFDLNKTKLINDRYGHLSGDKYIMDSVKIIAEEMGVRGYLGRFGGDEFIALLSYTDEEEIKEVAVKIKQRVSSIFSDEFIGISIGYSMYGKEGKTLKQLIKSADDKMYKDKGKNYTRNTFN